MRIGIGYHLYINGADFAQLPPRCIRCRLSEDSHQGPVTIDDAGTFIPGISLVLHQRIAVLGKGEHRLESAYPGEFVDIVMLDDISQTYF